VRSRSKRVAISFKASRDLVFSQPLLGPWADPRGDGTPAQQKKNLQQTTHLVDWLGASPSLSRSVAVARSLDEKVGDAERRALQAEERAGELQLRFLKAEEELWAALRRIGELDSRFAPL
jgi:hypothetical protein